MKALIVTKKRYEPTEISKGYANQILNINLSEKNISIKPVTEMMKEKFIGGKGFDLWLMWNGLPKDRIINWDDPENEICISNGPLGGTSLIPGSGKCIVTTISPLTGIIIDSNVGGHFGPYLKFSGFDSLELQGKAENEVVIFIDGENNEIRIEEIEGLPENSHLLTQELTKLFAEDEKDKPKISVISTGPGAKHTNWGMLNFSWYHRRRNWASYKQAGRGGIGTVFADKNIKAIVCRSPKKFKGLNPDNPDLIKKYGRMHSLEIIDADHQQNEMRTVGTGHLPEIMNEYDILPVENYRYGKHHELPSEDLPYHREVWREIFTSHGEGTDGCWMGCPLSCAHYVNKHRVLTGPYKDQIVPVDGPEYETIAGCGSNWGVWDPKWVLEANFYCDTYGLDTISVGTGIAFVMECYEAGILDSNKTGGLELRFGNAQAGIELIHQMARGEGFGVTVGKGIRQMKKIFTDKYDASPEFLHDIGMEHKGLEFSEYVTKESLTQQGGYGLTLKGPQHDEAWLIFEDVVLNSIPTFKDKAKALSWFPFWRTWFGLNGLCKLPWNDCKPLDNNENPIHDPNTGELCRARIPKHVAWYAKYYTGVTGRSADSDKLVADSERIYNFQRIFAIRQGKGLRENDSHLPYRAVGPVTIKEYESRQDRYDSQLTIEVDYDTEGKSTQEKMKRLRQYREDRYKKLQDAVYENRGWTSLGCPKIAKIKQLGLDFPDVIEVLKPHQND